MAWHVDKEKQEGAWARLSRAGSCALALVFAMLLLPLMAEGASVIVEAFRHGVAR